MSTQKRYTGGFEKDKQQRQPLDKNQNQKGQTPGGGGMGKTGQTDTFKKDKRDDKGGSQY